MQRPCTLGVGEGVPGWLRASVMAQPESEEQSRWGEPRSFPRSRPFPGREVTSHSPPASQMEPPFSFCDTTWPQHKVQQGPKALATNIHSDPSLRTFNRRGFHENFHTRICPSCHGVSVMVPISQETEAHWRPTPGLIPGLWFQNPALPFAAFWQQQAAR